MKRKAEDMKANINSLRNERMELDRRLLEMQSIIDSFKDEQKTIESALEEKRNEIKMPREKNTEMGNENLQEVCTRRKRPLNPRDEAGGQIHEATGSMDGMSSAKGEVGNEQKSTELKEEQSSERV
ncbi:hypothetical protein SLEP1_g22594 [Rubroshorea leprosula]|uniref:Uncharacterized protein n=1 Tax=Rubroshorea leprosula TaxID=152421 RepID=A0AAV5JGZ7_9ROSI|nr:hypothetical protein SLEP1_g22594 [Rubroshorea leprosula]